MAGYQFARTETLSRKGNSSRRGLTAVANELARKPDACPHVTTPRPPNVLAGMSPSDIPEHVEAAIKAQTAELRDGRKRGDHKIRSPRRDSHVVESQVYSWPETVDAIKADDETRSRYIAWCDDMIAHARADLDARGLDVLSIVEHMDEAHPHLHVVAMPRAKASPRLDARETHPGHLAMRDAQARGEQGAAAWSAAMRQWQDDVYTNVSHKYGLTRDGPKRRRETRAAWKARQHNAELQAQAAAHLTTTSAEIQAAAAAVAERERAVSARESAVRAREDEADLAAVQAALGVPQDAGSDSTAPEPTPEPEPERPKPRI